MTMTTMLAAMDKQIKLKIKTNGEASAMFSLHQVIPAIFHDDHIKPALTKNISYLSEVKSFNDWSMARVGLKARMEEKIHQACESIYQDINNSLPAASLAHSTCTMAVTKSKAWLAGLFSFIERSYRKLNDETKYTSAQAWSLTTQLVARIFTDLYKSRVGVVNNMHCGDIKNICGWVVYTSLKTHDAMEVYAEANFDNHPSIAAEYVKYLATNSGFEVIEELTHTVESLQADTVKNMADIKVITKKSDTASARADEVHKSTAGINKRLDALAAKINK